MTTRVPRAGQVEFLDMPFDAVGFKDALDLLLELAQRDRPTYAVTANVDHIVRFHRQPEVRPLYRNADLVVADGMPLIWASRLLGRPLPERVAGSDLFPALCAKAAENDLSVYLLGGAPGSAQTSAESSQDGETVCDTPYRTYCETPCAARRAARLLQTRHPRLRVVGTYCPDYGFEEHPMQAARVVAAIRDAQPDILFVGLGSPKQERWIVANGAVCGAKLSMGIGISFGFVCGAVRRAPRWMQRTGLEWLHRLCQEPHRLWRRYLLQDAAFLPLVLKYWLRRKRPPGEGGS